MTFIFAIGFWDHTWMRVEVVPSGKHGALPKAREKAVQKALAESDYTHDDIAFTKCTGRDIEA